MRIIILVQHLNEGGAERVASIWANGFVTIGHEVAVVIDKPLSFPQSFETKPQIKIYSIHPGKILNKVFHKWGVFQPIMYRRIFKKFNPDLIIGVLNPHAYWAWKAAKGMNIPIINTEHNVFERPDGVPLEPNVQKHKFEYNKLYDYVTVLTQADKDCLGNTIKHVSVLPNPLSFKPVSQLVHKKKTILAVGRWRVWYTKGFDVLVKAWSKIAQEHRDWTLQIAGYYNTKESAFIKSLLKENNVADRVQLLGFCNNIQQIMQESEIFVLSSRFEGFGMVLVEAMSQGCACISCDFKGRQSEIITNTDEGLTCPIDDANALSSAIDKMIRDDEYRKRVQLNAIERSKFYSVENTMNRWEKIIAEVKQNHA